MRAVVVVSIVLLSCVVAASGLIARDAYERALLAARESDPNAWRLIEVAEGERKWMQRKDILANLTGIPGQRSHYFDITDVPNLGATPAPEAPTIPTTPKQQAIINREYFEN